MDLLFYTVFALRVITMLLAGFIFYKGYLKHKKIQATSSQSGNNFIIFGVGILIFSFADLVEEILYEYTKMSLDNLHTIAAAISLIGFSVIFHSIHKS